MNYLRSERNQEKRDTYEWRNRKIQIIIEIEIYSYQYLRLARKPLQLKTACTFITDIEFNFC